MENAIARLSRNFPTFSRHLFYNFPTRQSSCLAGKQEKFKNLKGGKKVGKVGRWEVGRWESHTK